MGRSFDTGQVGCFQNCLLLGSGFLRRRGSDTLRSCRTAELSLDSVALEEVVDHIEWARIGSRGASSTKRCCSLVEKPSCVLRLRIAGPTHAPRRTSHVIAQSVCPLTLAIGPRKRRPGTQLRA